MKVGPGICNTVKEEALPLSLGDPIDPRHPPAGFPTATDEKSFVVLENSHAHIEGYDQALRNSGGESMEGTPLMPPDTSMSPPSLLPSLSHRIGGMGRSRDFRITVPRRDIWELFGDMPLKLPMEVMLKISIMGEDVPGDQMVSLIL